MLAAILAAAVLLGGCTQQKTVSNRPSPGNTGSDSLSSSSANNQSSSGTSSSKPSQQPRVIDGFVEPEKLDSDLLVDLRYATDNNVTHQVIYQTDVCVLRVGTAYKLVNANAILKKEGYCLKIWDAYRPPAAQKALWAKMPDPRYIADPNNGGSSHNMGCAVDITLVDLSHKDIEMPSDLDDFTIKASPKNPSMSADARAHLDLLVNAMTASGFTTISTEWWHFEDSDEANYSIVDLDLTQFMK